MELNQSLTITINFTSIAAYLLGSYVGSVFKGEMMTEIVEDALSFALVCFLLTMYFK